MRVDPWVLLVVIAVAIPFIIQSRTLAHYAGYDMTLTQVTVLGALVIGAIIIYAFIPDESTA